MHGKEKEDKGYTSTEDWDVKLVAEYMGLSFNQVENEIEYTEFLYRLRQAYISNCQGTQEGRDYIRECLKYEKIDGTICTLTEATGDWCGVD